MALLIDELVAMALRALSPAINDPYTAFMCIDRLGEALAYLGCRKLPSSYRYDESSNLRVITRALGFQNAIEAAFNQIRHYGSSDPLVAARLLKTVRIVGECVAPNYREPLQDYAKLIWEQSRHQLDEEHDRARSTPIIRQSSRRWCRAKPVRRRTASVNFPRRSVRCGSRYRGSRAAGKAARRPARRTGRHIDSL